MFTVTSDFRIHESPEALTGSMDSDFSRLLKGMLAVCCSLDLCVKRERESIIHYSQIASSFHQELIPNCTIFPTRIKRINGKIK